MSEYVDIAKTGLVIQGILARLDKPAGLAQVANLVYLVDNRFYESAGRTLTGNAYARGVSGPIVVGNVIAFAMEELVNCGKVIQTPVESAQGCNAFTYSSASSVSDWVSVWTEVALHLDAGEEQILRDIIRQYGSIADAAQLAEVAMQTAPFANAKPGDRLQFEQSRRAIELQAALQDKWDSDPEFRQGVMQEFEDMEADRWIWAEDLDEKFGLCESGEGD